LPVPRTCPKCSKLYDGEISRCPDDGADLGPLPAEKDELIGRAVGSYTVTRLLGKGGMGAVYLAEHPVIGSRVAIKFLHPRFSGDRKIVERFFNEARAVNVIGHDNILKILDLDVTADGRHYFVMEFLHGQPLSDLVRPGAPIALGISGPIILQVCEALQAAHDHGIVHRDLKPDNVHLTLHKGKKNFVKVVDFGIAKLSDESGLSAGNTQTGTVMGTPGYMSPEQARGASARIDGRSDIYSLGCMMFQMATGRLPFKGSSFGEVLVAHLHQPPPRPRELVREIPEALETVILRCLEKKQEDRFASMREVHDAIAQAMDRLGVSRDLPEAGTTETGVAPPAIRAPAEVSPTALLSPGGDLAVQSTAQLKRTAAAAPRRKAGRSLRVGLGACVIAAAAAAGLLVAQQRARARQASAEQAARLAAERVAREAARRAADEQKAREAEKVLLSVVSEPPGAAVEASWKDGSRTAVTPFELPVPRNATVHFAFAKSDYLARTTDVVADAPRVVDAQLAPTPKPPPVARSRKANPARSKQAQADQTKPAQPDPKAKRATAETSDDTIPVDF
jgi:serine/threonine protein kinase